MKALGRLEAEVMEVAWRHAPVTAREVCDRMSGTKERAYTTIMTTMVRLHRKGLLVRQKDGLAWRYDAAMSRPELEAELAHRMAARILDAYGDTALAAIVRAAGDADRSMLKRLRELIDAVLTGPPRLAAPNQRGPRPGSTPPRPPPAPPEHR